MVKIFKVCICGCRTFNDYEFFKEKCLFYLKNKLPKVIIISGGAKGADALAVRFAEEFNLGVMTFKPRWDIYGKAAGPKRNEDMVLTADGVIAFWDFKSRGTKSTIQFCKKHNVDCKVVKIGGLNNE